MFCLSYVELLRRENPNLPDPDEPTGNRFRRCRVGQRTAVVGAYHGRFRNRGNVPQIERCFPQRGGLPVGCLDRAQSRRSRHILWKTLLHLLFSH